MASTNILAEITKPHLKKNAPDLSVGDTVRVHQRIKDVDAKGKERERIQVFEGVVIARKHGAGIEGTFTVRKIAAGGIGVERVYPIHSPNIVKIERLKSSRVRQSKLYYLRHIRSATMRLPKETRETAAIWEEKGAEEEIEALKQETAEAAEANAEVKAEEELIEGQAEAEQAEVDAEVKAEVKSDEKADEAPSDDTPADKPAEEEPEAKPADAA